MDRKLLLTLIEKFNGGPAGIETIAASLREDRETIEDVYEPYLLQEGLLERTPRGRVATRRVLRSCYTKTIQRFGGIVGIVDQHAVGAVQWNRPAGRGQIVAHSLT